MPGLRALLVCETANRHEDGALDLLGIRRKFRTNADGNVTITAYAYVGGIEPGEFPSTFRSIGAANDQIMAQWSEGNEAFQGVDEYIEHVHVDNLAIVGRGEWQMWLV